MAQIYGELIRAQLHLSASDLTPTASGLMYFNTTSSTFKWYTGSAWVTAADTSTAQTFTNKTLTAPNIDQVLYTEAAAPSTPASGKLAVYAKADSKLYSKNSSGVETAIGSGSGSGEVNVIESPNDANSWVASGAGITVTTSTTASDLPLGPVVDTAIKITPVSGTDYVYYRWTMPESLKNRKLKFEWYQRPLSGYASGDIKAEIYKNAASNYGGAYTEFSLSTDVSGTTSIPNSTGKFTTYFDTDDGDYYELRFVRVSGTTALNVTAVVVGPGIQPQGAVVGNWTSFTPTLGATFGTVSASEHYYRRVGDSIEVRGRFTAGTLAGGSATLGLPSGLSVNTSLFTTSGREHRVGVAQRVRSGSGGVPGDTQAVIVDTAVSSSVQISSDTSGGAFVDSAAGAFIVASDDVVYFYTVPVSEFASSGVLNTAQNDVEYAYNTSTADSSDTTSFGYGPGGAQFGSFTASRDKRVRFQTPIQPTDSLVFEVTGDGGVTWRELGESSNVGVWAVQNGVLYGVSSGGVSSTDVDVTFGQYRFASATTYGGAGATWAGIAGSATHKWRLKKISAGVAVGFGLASNTVSGLVKLPGDYVYVNSASGRGSTATRRRNFTGSATTSGTAITYAQSATNGSTFTINQAGVYSVVYGDSGSAQWGAAISRNSNGITNPGSLTAFTNRLAKQTIQAGFEHVMEWTGVLNSGDIVEAVTDTAADGTSDNVFFWITQVAKL